MNPIIESPDVPNHLCDLRRYVANVAITASALRKQGAAGFVSTAREFLANLDLKTLASVGPSEYPDWLETQTQALAAKFPINRWGPARKAINIFMVMASLNRFLCGEYALERFDDVLEVPLDGIVAGKLRTYAREHKLFSEKGFPEWESIKALDAVNSAKYQTIAQHIARELGIPRGRLDVALWGGRRTNL